MRRGLLVTDFWYTRVLDQKSLVITGLTRNGVWLVEDGGAPVAYLIADKIGYAINPGGHPELASGFMGTQALYAAAKLGVPVARWRAERDQAAVDELLHHGCSLLRIVRIVLDDPLDLPPPLPGRSRGARGVGARRRHHPAA